MVTFLNGFDSKPRIFIKYNEYSQLSSDYRAYEMPEIVTRWIKELLFIAKNIYDFFTKKSLEVFQKWMNCWLYLSLNVCHLGGFYSHEFAKAYTNVILNLCFPSIPTLYQLLYIKFLESDIEKDNTNDYALTDSIFQNEFIHYAQS
ncbi:hypothetical protein RhiirA4_483587 [Rhizophagus irregularis]|uniref:Uncharacterized protein n=1 Tax=Rhizophagus irregularis TaxID=588596 RepID=A0A2I1HMT7_9GLOM|nr:hypothetical protein RhiirA4_483587 [Rhizophagus irregularis]